MTAILGRHPLFQRKLKPTVNKVMAIAKTAATARVPLALACIRSLKLSQYPFSQGDPSSMYAVVAPTVLIQSLTASAIIGLFSHANLSDSIQPRWYNNIRKLWKKSSNRIFSSTHIDMGLAPVCVRDTTLRSDGILGPTGLLQSIFGRR